MSYFPNILYTGIGGGNIDTTSSVEITFSTGINTTPYITENRGEFTVKLKGWWEIYARVNADVLSVSSQNQIRMALELNEGSGYSEVSGTARIVDLTDTGTNYERDGGVISTIRLFNKDDTLRVLGTRSAGSNTIRFLSNRLINIKFLGAEV